MLEDDKDSRELNIAALDETEKRVASEDEAIAEEEFVSHAEDEVNPMLFDETVEEEPVEPTEEEKLLDGAIGSGNLEIPEQPFNNEEALRNENVNEEDKKTPTTETDGALVDPFASVEDAGTTTVADTAVDSSPEVTEVTAPASEPEAAPVEEPVAGPEPVAAPAPAEPADPISAAVPADPAAAAPAEQPKKKKGKGGIIALIIILLLLIGGGIGFFVWYTMHETPEKSLSDAISKLWEADDIKVKGDIKSVTSNEDEKVETTITLDAGVSGKNTSANFGFNVAMGDTKFDLGLGLISADKVSYIKVDNAKGVTDALFDLIQNLSKMSFDEDEEEVVEDEGEELSPQMQVAKAMFDGLGEALSDTWIKIDSEDIPSMKCVVDKSDALNSAEFKKKIAEIYEEHAFIAVTEDAKVTEKDGLKYIPITIKKDEYNAFVKAVKELQEFKDLNSCEGMSFKLDEMKDEDLKDLSIKFGIKGFSHELMAIELSQKNEKEKTESTATLKLSYEKTSIAAPSDAKTLEDINKTFKEKTKAKAKEAMKKYVEDTCKSMVTGETQVKSCVDTAWPQIESSIDEEFDEIDLESLLKQAGGLTTSLTSSVN